MAELSPISESRDTPNLGISPDLSAPVWGLGIHEVKVLRALAEGGGAKAAARLLGQTVKAVEYRITRIHLKMGTTSSVRCVLLAERAGLLEGIQ